MEDKNVHEAYEAIRTAYAALQTTNPNITMQEMVAGALAMAAMITGLHPEGHTKGLWAVGYFVELLDANIKSPEELLRLVAEGRLVVTKSDVSE